MNNKKLIIFNVDGALLLSTDKIIVLWSEAIRAAGLRPNFRIICRNWDKPFLEYTIPSLAKDGHWTEEQTNLVIEKSKELFNDATFNSPAGLPEKLVALKNSGYELGIITNHDLNFFQESLSDLGLDEKIFSFVKTADDGIKKPDPHVFDQALEKFKAEDIVFVGNSHRTDLLAAYSCIPKIDFVAIESTCIPRGAFLAEGVPENMVVDSVISFIDDMLTLKRYN